MAKAEKSTRARRYKRIMLLSIFIIVFSAMILPLGGYVVSGIQEAQAQQVQDTNPRANYWRAVRGGEGGYSAVTGRSMDGNVINTETSMLINNGGQNWRQLRNGPVANIGGWLLFLVILSLVVFYAIRGPVQIEAGRAGTTVPRWALWERWLHWMTAILFIILAITGLSFLFGRVLLIPLFGPAGFAGWANFSISLHNFLGPVFSVGVLLMILVWFKNNLPASYDVEWFKQGLGMVKGKHGPAGKANAGEKLFVYWLGLVVVGITVCVTGFILNFPDLGATREDMQLANLIHGISSLVWMMLVCGHAYLGSVGVEGAYEGMSTGRVDANWAKQHHDHWYEEIKKKGSEPARGDGEESTVIKGQPA